MADKICIKCGYEGRGKKTPRGSKTVEILIYATILIPGPFYSIWRRMRLPEPCPNCKYPNLFSKESTEGQIAQKKFDMELGLIPHKAVSKTELNYNAPVVMSAKSEPPLNAVNEPRKPVDPEAW